MQPTLLQTQAKRPPSIDAIPLAAIGEGALDEATFKALEADKLFQAMNSAKTLIGQVGLYRSLAYPLASLEAVQAKQEALREIDANAELKKQIEELVGEAQEREADFYRLLYGTFLGFFGNPANDLEVEGYGYEPYRRGTRFMLNLVERAKAMSAPRSAYLKDLFARLGSFASSRSYALMHGPVYRTESAVITRAEKHWYTPALKFRPTLFKPFFFLFFIGCLMGVFYFGGMTFLLPGVGSGSLFVTIVLPLVAICYVAMVATYDRDNCIIPLRNYFRDSGEVHQALEVLAQLDELLSLSHYAHNFVSYMTMPELYAAPRHALKVTQARNPILAKDNPLYVANSIELDGNPLCFITGPNSGGKTAFCKTLAQIQLLAQIGSYVPASEVRLSVADAIFYQVPASGSLEEAEGRFGAELKRTKAIFMAATAQSLVILDELSEGTTHEEKLDTAYTVLDGFYRKGNNTILITHNHQLVDLFVAKRIGVTRQVEFKEHEPTYRLIEGISRVSHAERVARRIGFAKEDIDRHLNEQRAGE